MHKRVVATIRMKKNNNNNKRIREMTEIIIVRGFFFTETMQKRGG